jgi:hypothetical protein
VATEKNAATAAGDELAAVRSIREQWVDYPADGPWRPAERKLWFVVVGADGLEVTRSLKRDVAELYL